MTPPALTIIRAEHQALRAILHALRHLVAGTAQADAKPPFEALRALLFYIDAYPERLHHPKETEHLFRRLRQCCDEDGDVLDRLDRDHGLGEQEILRLEHLLLEYEMLGASRQAAFAQAVDRFCDRYLEHMGLEEAHVLPLAARVLTEADWREINEAFQANRDPLTGHRPEQEFEALFRRIINLLPAHLGFGPAA